MTEIRVVKISRGDAESNLKARYYQGPDKAAALAKARKSLRVCHTSGQNTYTFQYRVWMSGSELYNKVEHLKYELL